MYVYKHMYVCMYVACIYVCHYVCVFCVCVCACVYVRMYICVCVYIYMYVCVYIYMYIIYICYICLHVRYMWAEPSGPCYTHPHTAAPRVAPCRRPCAAIPAPPAVEAGTPGLFFFSLSLYTHTHIYLFMCHADRNRQTDRQTYYSVKRDLIKCQKRLNIERKTASPPYTSTSYSRYDAIHRYHNAATVCLSVRLSVGLF